VFAVHLLALLMCSEYKFVVIVVFLYAGVLFHSLRSVYFPAFFVCFAGVDVFAVFMFMYAYFGISV
jgi:hypothetical protein